MPPLCQREDLRLTELLLGALRNPCMDFRSQIPQVIEALCQPSLKSTHILLNTKIKKGIKRGESEGTERGRRGEEWKDPGSCRDGFQVAGSSGRGFV